MGATTRRPKSGDDWESRHLGGTGRPRPVVAASAAYLRRLRRRTAVERRPYRFCKARRRRDGDSPYVLRA